MISVAVKMQFMDIEQGSRWHAPGNARLLYDFNAEKVVVEHLKCVWEVCCLTLDDKNIANKHS